MTKTLLNILDAFISERANRNYSINTLNGDRWTIKTFLTYIGVTYQVHTADQLRKDHVVAYQNHLLHKQTPKGMPLKPRAINHQLIPIRLYLRYLKTHGYITQSLDQAILSMKEPKLLPRSILTHAQVKRLLRKIDTTTVQGIRNRAILELLYSSGIRSGELVILTLDDVDLANGRLKVFGKGQKERVVPIGKTAIRYLQSYIRGVRPFILGSQHTRHIFLSRLGKPYSQKSLQVMVRKYAAAQFDMYVSPHTFRRSCTTELVKANANIYHVKEMLGHSSLDTLKPYINLAINDLRKTHAKCHPRERDV